MNAHDAEIHILTETLIYELAKALALPQTDAAKRMVRFIFGKAARVAAEVGIGLDRATAEGGLPAGALGSAALRQIASSARRRKYSSQWSTCHCIQSSGIC